MEYDPAFPTEDNDEEIDHIIDVTEIPLPVTKKKSKRHSKLMKIPLPDEVTKPIVETSNSPPQEPDTSWLLPTSTQGPLKFNIMKSNTIKATDEESSVFEDLELKIEPTKAPKILPKKSKPMALPTGVIVKNADFVVNEPKTNTELFLPPKIASVEGVTPSNTNMDISNLPYMGSVTNPNMIAALNNPNMINSYPLMNMSYIIPQKLRSAQMISQPLVANPAVASLSQKKAQENSSKSENRKKSRSSSRGRRQSRSKSPKLKAALKKSRSPSPKSNLPDEQATEEIKPLTTDNCDELMEDTMKVTAENDGRKPLSGMEKTERSQERKSGSNSGWGRSDSKMWQHKSRSRSGSQRKPRRSNSKNTKQRRRSRSKRSVSAKRNECVSSSSRNQRVPSPAHAGTRVPGTKQAHTRSNRSGSRGVAGRRQRSSSRNRWSPNQARRRRSTSRNRRSPSPGPYRAYGRGNHNQSSPNHSRPRNNYGQSSPARTRNRRSNSRARRSPGPSRIYRSRSRKRSGTPPRRSTSRKRYGDAGKSREDPWQCDSDDSHVNKKKMQKSSDCWAVESESGSQSTPLLASADACDKVDISCDPGSSVQENPVTQDNDDKIIVSSSDTDHSRMKLDKNEDATVSSTVDEIGSIFVGSNEDMTTDLSVAHKDKNEKSPKWSIMDKKSHSDEMKNDGESRKSLKKENKQQESSRSSSVDSNHASRINRNIKSTDSNTIKSRKNIDNRQSEIKKKTPLNSESRDVSRTSKISNSTEKKSEQESRQTQKKERISSRSKSVESNHAQDNRKKVDSSRSKLDKLEGEYQKSEKKRQLSSDSISIESKNRRNLKINDEKISKPRKIDESRQSDNKREVRQSDRNRSNSSNCRYAERKVKKTMKERRSSSANSEIRLKKSVKQTRNKKRSGSAVSENEKGANDQVESKTTKGKVKRKSVSSVDSRHSGRNPSNQRLRREDYRDPRANTRNDVSIDSRHKRRVENDKGATNRRGKSPWSFHSEDERNEIPKKKSKKSEKNIESEKIQKQRSTNKRTRDKNDRSVSNSESQSRSPSVKIKKKKHSKKSNKDDKCKSKKNGKQKSSETSSMNSEKIPACYQAARKSKRKDRVSSSESNQSCELIKRKHKSKLVR